MIKDISTATILALMCVFLCFCILILTLCGFAHCSVETQTQIVSICSMVITSILAFYFGASHQKKNDLQQQNIIQNEQ